MDVGTQGAGKGTLSDWLLDKYDIESVVVGQLLRQEILNGTELGKEAESTMKRGGSSLFPVLRLTRRY